MSLSTRKRGAQRTNTVLFVLVHDLRSFFEGEGGTDTEGEGEVCGEADQPEIVAAGTNNVLSGHCKSNLCFFIEILLTFD